MRLLSFLFLICWTLFVPLQLAAQQLNCAEFQTTELSNYPERRSEIDKDVKSAADKLQNQKVEIGKAVDELRSDLEKKYSSPGQSLYIRFAVCQLASQLDLDSEGRKQLREALISLGFSTGGRATSHDSTDPVGTLVEFLFATSRGRADVRNRPRFSHERVNALTLGAARVHVPEEHRIGQLELPGNRTIFGITLSREDADPRRHFILRGVKILGGDDWLSIARQSDEALVFVHGYNTSFDDALLRMAQIVYDLQYTGTRVLFSWPSRGGTLAYAYDQNSALGARERFIELIQLLEKEAGIKKVHVLAHSMGNLVVLDALYNQARSANPVRIGELIMAAPDVDQDHYRQAMKEITKIASGLTLYASSADKAMVASRKLASAPRAGDVSRNQPVLVEGVEAIDVTAIGNELFGLNHDVFAAQRSLLNDIKLIMSKGIRPPTERLIEIRRVSEGAAKPLYWRYVP